MSASHRPLPVRALGPWAVSAIGLGCMNVSHAYGVPLPPEAAAALLQHALTGPRYNAATQLEIDTENFA